MLCLIETGTPDVQTAIGMGSSANTGVSDAKWRGICDMWGGIPQFVSGITTKPKNSQMKIESKSRNGNNVTVSYTQGTGGWIKAMGTGSGTDYNLEDIFLPVSVVAIGGESGATYADHWKAGTSETTAYVAVGSTETSPATTAGLFAMITYVDTSKKYTTRIAKCITD